MSNTATPVSSSQSTPVTPLQFPGGGPIVFVRNTFIDVDDCSPSQALLRKSGRFRTLPATVHKMVGLEEIDDFDGGSSGGESTAESTSSNNQCSSHSSMDESHGSNNLSNDCSMESFIHPVQVYVSTASTPVTSIKPQLTSARCPRQIHVPRSQTLECTNEANGFFHICWNVDARKLRGSEKQAISPPAELPLGPRGQSIQLRIAIYPKALESAGAVNFRSSKGKGYIQIKCESDSMMDLDPVCITMSIGTGCLSQPARGPIKHDFARNGICTLPRDQNIWDFSLAVETENLMFPILLKMRALSSGS